MTKQIGFDYSTNDENENNFVDWNNSYKMRSKCIKIDEGLVGQKKCNKK